MVGFEAHPSESKNHNKTPSARARQLIVAEEQDSDGEKDDDHIPGPPGPARKTSSRGKRTGDNDMLDLFLSMDASANYRRGNGVLASTGIKDLRVPSDVFAEGCKLLQQVALGNLPNMETLLRERPSHVNFRD